MDDNDEDLADEEEDEDEEEDDVVESEDVAEETVSAPKDDGEIDELAAALGAVRV